MPRKSKCHDISKLHNNLFVQKLRSQLSYALLKYAPQLSLRRWVYPLMKFHLFTFTATLCVTSYICIGELHGQSRNSEKQGGNDWSAEEYSGSRTEKNLRAAMTSKGFAWLSGSPADNEKLSIGKNAQFFGFVALRYQSGRAANRGALGRGFFAISDQTQREILPKAVLAEDAPLKKWWEVRKEILRLFENHLYNSEEIDEKLASELGVEWSKLGAAIAIHEARGFAALEDALSDEQRAQLKVWRENPEKSHKLGQKGQIRSDDLNRDQLKQLEDLYAKAFSWITGTSEDNEIIPLGQPAQFFGFVSIRHKSGHAANRGKISKSFLEILDRDQSDIIDHAIDEQMPVVKRFLEQRHRFLEELALLRTEPNVFDEDRAMELAAKMGELEVKAGWIEAKAYRKIRESMTAEQTSQMMKLRGDYVLDEAQVALLSPEERGAQLAILCAGCHGTPGNYRAEMIGPSLEGVFDRPIASQVGFQYSDALRKLNDGKPWTVEKLDGYLASPKTYAQGTKMEFQGLLKPADRKDLINYLKQTR